MSNRKSHPGEILRKNYLEPLGISVTEAAEQIGVTRQTLNNVLNGKAGISPDMAIRLGRLFGVRTEKILQIQKDYELTSTRMARARRDVGRRDSYHVSSSQIVAWAESDATAPYLLPQLIRKLIRANAPSQAMINFPADVDARRSGWDGLVESPKATAYVPLGQSGWEVSTEAKSQAKAERDYQARKADPLGLIPRDTTFVAVSAKRWSKKGNWVAEKKKEDFWSNVIAFDAINIEQWLEICPDVAIWFAEKIGCRPRGVQSLGDLWEVYRLSTDPPMTPDFLVAGRKKEAETVAKWLETGSGVLRVLADSTDEALAFVSAVVVLNQETAAKREYTEIIVTTDGEQVRQLMGASHQLTFGWRIDDPSLLGIVVDREHRAVVPLSRATVLTEHADIELPRLGRADFTEAIKDALPHESIEVTGDLARDEQAKRNEEDKREKEAGERARKSGRSITVYRRMFPKHGVVVSAPWATPERGQELIPVLLAGSWSEANDSDKLAISKLAGTDYDTVSKAMMRCKNQPDSPVRRIGDAWSLVAPLDAWSLLARLISDSDLGRFSQTVEDVLGESDPRLQLAPKERWLARLHDKDFKHSGDLRQGLAESLILHAVVVEESATDASNTNSRLSHRLVAKLLNARSDEKRWASISGLLPHLAEAAPQAFLDALETNLAEASSHILCLFEDEDFPWGGGNRHTYLLWALEALAWYPEYLPRVALILAKLASLKLEIKIVNSPRNSLREIFCMWHRNNVSSLDDRLQILDRLVKRQPEVGWDLLLNLLPNPHEVSSNTSAPRWRAKPEITPVTYGEIWKAHEELVSRVLTLSDLDGSRLATLCTKIASWSPIQRQRFLECIRVFSDGSKNTAARLVLWKSLLGFVSRHRSFRGADWALPETELAPFDAALQSLKPEDIGESKLWLFDDHLPDLPDSKGGSFEDRQREADEARQKAVRMIMQQQGLDGLLALAKRVKLPWEIGISLAIVAPESRVECELLERTLTSENSNERKLGRGYVVRSYTIKGDGWADQFLRSDIFKSWPPSKQADFCLGLPEEPSTWRLVSGLGSIVETQYWAQTFVFLSRLGIEEDAEFAIAKLLGCGRALYAFDEAALNPGKVSLDTLIKILERTLVELAKAGDKLPVGQGFTWSLGRIFEKLRASDDIPIDKLGGLEWQYLPLLRFQEEAVSLHRFLQKEPKFFAELVAYVFRSELEVNDTATPSDVPEKEDRGRALRAWEVLESWHTLPGSRPNSTIDAAELTNWVREARSLCIAQHRAVKGDERIGKLLSHVPQDIDGIWPHKSVRELLEEIDSKVLESGMHSGKFNQRGVTQRAPLEGGRQEREIAKTYRNWEKVVASKWPNTARLLKSLADTYESLAGVHDVSAEKLDLEY